MQSPYTHQSAANGVSTTLCSTRMCLLSHRKHSLNWDIVVTTDAKLCALYDSDVCQPPVP